MCRKRLLALGLVLGFLTPAAFGAPAVVDTDGDGVGDDVERWLQRNGAAVSPTVSNGYSDTDLDGIPDLVETYLTKTNPAVSDSTVCAGGGTPVDMTGQYDLRVSANLANPVSVLTDDLLAMSICHIGGVVTIFNTRMGYADSASFTGGPTYTLSATWNNGGGPGIPISATGTCTGTCATVDGTSTLGPSRLTRRTVLTSGSAAAVSGAVYGIQFIDDPKPAGASAFNTSHIGAESVQMTITSGAKARLDHKQVVLSGYYVTSVGTYFIADSFTDTYPSGPTTTVTETGYASYSMMFTAIPAAGVGGMIRGGGFEIIDSDSGPTSYRRDTWHGKAQVPNTIGVTLNTPTGVRSFLALNNVPTSADTATVSGPGLPTTTVFNDLDADLTNNKGEYYSPTGGSIPGVVKHRARIPAFTDGEAVGLAGNGNDLNISNISYNHSTTLPSNTYTFTFAGALGGFTTVNVAHTDYSSTPLAVATGVQWDGAPLTSLTNVNMAVSHTLTWNAVTTGGVGNNGVGTAGLYRVIISAPDGGQLEYANSGSNSVNRFLSPAVAVCSGGGTCTYTIAADTLGSFEGYRIVIEARDDNDSNNRSRTDGYSINVPGTRTNDFNGDGRSDILWRHTSGLTVQWLMNGATTTSAANLGGDANWTVAQTGDFNGDGQSDILWRHSSGLTVQWLMSGATVTSAANLGGDADWTVIKTGDFNGDGRSDILWRHTSGLTVQWLMNGATTTSAANLGGDANWTVAQTGDFNGDGQSDILWRHSSGLTVQWLMSGATVTSAANLGGDADWTVIKTGDFNGDGRSDILWRHTSGLTVQWLMNGATTTSAANLGGDANWTVAQTGDFNGDGQSDILWRHSSGLTVQWLMSGATVTSAANLGGDADWTVVQ